MTVDIGITIDLTAPMLLLLLLVVLGIFSITRKLPNRKGTPPGRKARPKPAAAGRVNNQSGPSGKRPDHAN